MSVLKIRNDKGEIVEVLALKGEKGDPGAGRQTENGSVIFTDYVNNISYAGDSALFGTDNMTGYKGYPISTLTLSEDAKSAVVTLADNNIEPTAFDSYVVGDVVQLDIRVHWYNVFEITEASQNEDGNTVLVIAYPSGEKITRLMALDSDETQNWIWVVGKPVGLPIECQTACAVFGTKNLSAGSGTAVMGKENLGIGNYSAVFGRKNKAGYCSFAGGCENDAMGQYSFVVNYRNTASGIYTACFGEKCTASGIRTFVTGCLCESTGDNSFAGGNVCRSKHFNSFVFGNCLTSTADNQTLFGKYGKATEDMLFMIGNGTETDYSDAFAVYEDGHAEVMTQGTTDNSVVTKAYVDSLISRIEKLEQAIIALGGTVTVAEETEE